MEQIELNWEKPTLLLEQSILLFYADDDGYRFFCFNAACAAGEWTVYDRAREN